MKLGHIIYYHDVFFKFDNGLDLTMALCYENSPFETMSALKLNSFDQNFMIFGHIV